MVWSPLRIENADGGLQKCQDLGAQDTDPEYSGIQIHLLMKLHEPYETEAHPLSSEVSKKTCETACPGTIPEKELKHRTRLDMGKVNHFLEFASLPVREAAWSSGLGRWI